MSSLGLITANLNNIALNILHANQYVRAIAKRDTKKGKAAHLDLLLFG